VVRDVRAVLGRARGNVHLQKSHRRTRPSDASRTASERGSSRCSRTSMNTCGECSAGQRGRSSTRTARKSGPCWSRAMEGTWAPGKASALTCGGWNGATRLENRALRVPFPGASKGVRGSISAEPPRADKAAELFHPCLARAWWPNGPKPAACRQARGRRRPDDREVVRRRPVPQGGNTALGTSSKSNAGGFSHGAGPRVSGDDAPQQRVLVTRNVGCRSGFEAS